MFRLVLLLAITLLAGCDPPKQQLNLFIWSEFLDPQIIADFEKQFACRVNVDFFEDPDSMIAKLVAGGVSTYDIVVPSDTTLPAMSRRGLLAPLRRENIPNLRHLDPQFTNAPFDPGNQFSAPITWGTAGIYLRRPKDQSVEDSWGLIFDPAKQMGPFLLLEDIRTSIGAALRYRGYSLNTTNAQELAEARDLLIATKQRSLGFEGGTGCRNRVLAGGVALAVAYNGDAIRGTQEDSETTYVFPREGSVMYMDTLSIPARAPHRDLAEKFINFVLDPKVSAQFSRWSHFATPNQTALQFIDPADRGNPAIYPPPEIMRRLEYANDLGDQNRLYDELWTQIKAK